MHYYIGIDLGTSAMKLLLTDAKGCIYNTVSKIAAEKRLTY